MKGYYKIKYLMHIPSVHNKCHVTSLYHKHHSTVTPLSSSYTPFSQAPRSETIKLLVCHIVYFHFIYIFHAFCCVFLLEYFFYIYLFLCFLCSFPLSFFYHLGVCAFQSFSTNKIVTAQSKEAESVLNITIYFERTTWYTVNHFTEKPTIRKENLTQCTF